MGRKGMGRGKKSLEDKIYELDSTYASETRAGTAEQIKDKLVKLARYEEELEEAKKNDQDLASKKEEVRVANQTYSEPLKALKLKKAFALKVLTEKGQ